MSPGDNIDVSWVSVGLHNLCLGVLEVLQPYFGHHGHSACCHLNLVLHGDSSLACEETFARQSQVMETFECHSDLQRPFCFRQSIGFYRGKYEKEEEEELQTIMELDKQNEMSFGGQIQELTSAAFLRPFKCVGVIYLLYALSGIHIIHTYTLTFLEVNLILCSDLLSISKLMFSLRKPQDKI